MAGVFGAEINSRADFFEILRGAGEHISSVLSRRPNDPTLQSVGAQIAAIESWTANGRLPTLEERKKISAGYQMYREFECEDDAEIQTLRRETTIIQNYFRYWPDDAVARTPRTMSTPLPRVTGR